MTVNQNSMMPSYASQIMNTKSTASNSSDESQSTAASQGFDAIAKMLMAALDINQTGSVDKTEFTEAAKVLAKGQSIEDVENTFSKIDANADNSISSNEFLNALRDASEKKQQLKQHTDRNALDSTLLTDQINKLTKIHSPSDEAQKSLFNKITAAYASPTSAMGTTTNISV